MGLQRAVINGGGGEHYCVLVVVSSVVMVVVAVVWGLTGWLTVVIIMSLGWQRWQGMQWCGTYRVADGHCHHVLVVVINCQW